MAKRSRQIGRILNVQTGLRKDAEARLGALNARRDALRAVESAILATLASDDPVQRALAPLAGDRLRWVDRDLKDLEAQRRVAEAHWRGLAQRSLVAERLRKAAELGEQREAERKGLEDLLADVESRRTSLP
jgi:ATP/maltotriose-dependent transcriptional regulator MalT